MDLERCLKKQGMTWTWEQIRTCWKKLKKRFTAERLLLCKSGGEPSKWKWFDKMSLLLGDRPMVQARDYGVDTAAEDEDIVLPQRREARAQAWRSGNRYRKTGFRLASTQSIAAITAHLNSSVRVHINSGASREKVQELASVDQYEAVSRIKKSLKSFSELDDFMRLAGVVKCGVTCHSHDDGKKQLVDIGLDCWSLVRQYIKVGDILD
ncbi:hypothetical protein HPB51_019658 [Rhipicephalus microplus]|uniref:Uncharacterized protein n=1 Tax=Rhipicephalus microplus TaxID=6941 RepID=A0A9J6EBG5_RHIMP|nr:hypothetical protein HPB51_019658 [Rhipicephalus microplus]